MIICDNQAVLCKKEGEVVLILIVVDDNLWSLLTVLNATGNPVLILIVVDDNLWSMRAFHDDNGEVGLNPYCGGW